MTKSKRQLRAEAVERLSNLGEVGYYYEIIDTLCDADCDNWTSEKVATTIRDLLTDGEPTDVDNREKLDGIACMACWKAHERELEKRDKGIERLKRRRDELEAERDDYKRKLEILNAHGVEIVDAVAGGFEVYNKAIRERDELDATCDELIAELGDAEGTNIILKRRCDELETERDNLKIYRDSWENKASILESDVERLVAERDELMRKLEAADRHELERDGDCDECKALHDGRMAELQAEVDAWRKLADGIELPDYPITQFVPKDGERAREKSRQEPSEAVCAPINDKNVTECGNEVNGAEIGSESLDAVELMRKYRLYEIGSMLHPGKIIRPCTLEQLADMVERDYVRRDEALAKLERANREREIYRDACGRLLDLADEMRLVRLDGCDDGCWVDMDGEVIS